jgi:triosephosphate isomerase
MNKTAAEAKALMTEMLPALQAVSSDVEKVVCPPATSVPAVAEILKGTEIGLGTQNMHWEDKGAFTGELAPAMVKEFCGYVILGHSERRGYFGETDEMVNKKIKAALANGLTPIVCIGETLEENQSGQTEAVLTKQIVDGFEGIDAADAPKVIVAYEPIWAIGTGLAASADDANTIIGGTVRAQLKKVFGEEAAEAMRILYGGSVKPGNAAEYFSKPEIDGALVGGASLKTEDFAKITEAAA